MPIYIKGLSSCSLKLSSLKMRGDNTMLYMQIYRTMKDRNGLLVKTVIVLASFK